MRVAVPCEVRLLRAQLQCAALLPHTLAMSKNRPPYPRRWNLISAAALLALGCSDTDLPDNTIVLQLFKPRGLELGRVTIRATQDGGRSGTVEVGDIFSDCSKNRVNILPAQMSGRSNPIDVTISSSVNAVKAVSTRITPPAGGPVAIAIGGSGPGLVPEGCAPATFPDGGTDDGGPGDAGTGENRPTGEACERESDCAGDTCLDVLWVDTTRKELPGGYCTNRCDTTVCGANEECVASVDGTGTNLGSYCLKGCDSQGDCRPGYTCTVVGRLCVP